jgi:diketogulonate reductase-like aldo/keto reductase
MPYFSSDDLQTQLEKSFMRSKENLKVDFIDSYLIHSPFNPIEDFLSVYKTMEEFVNDGQVGQLGISNCYDINLLIYLYDNAEIKPKVVQNRFYADSKYDKEIREFCKQKDITYQSFWSLTANPKILNGSKIRDIALKHERTIAQVFYKFLNQIGITPLNGTTSKQHMIEDLAIDSFTLDEEDVNSLMLFI